MHRNCLLQHGKVDMCVFDGGIQTYSLNTMRPMLHFFVQTRVRIFTPLSGIVLPKTLTALIDKPFTSKELPHDKRKVIIYPIFRTGDPCYMEKSASEVKLSMTLIIAKAYQKGGFCDSCTDPLYFVELLSFPSHTCPNLYSQ